MIPPFEDSGYLPPGIHRATLAEIEKRFGQSSELRRVQMDSIRWMVDLAKQGVHPEFSCAIRNRVVFYKPS